MTQMLDFSVDVRKSILVMLGSIYVGFIYIIPSEVLMQGP